MKKYAVVHLDNKVYNIFDWAENAPPNLGPKHRIIDITSLSQVPAIGDAYINGAFYSPDKK